jgi:hypothetical protein
MSPEQIARQYYRLFNERNLDAAGQLVDRAASFRYLPSKQNLIGRAGYRALAAMWLNAFEDGQLEVVSLQSIAADTVVVNLLGRGSHTGDLVFGEALTIPATGVMGATISDANCSAADTVQCQRFGMLRSCVSKTMSIRVSLLGVMVASRTRDRPDGPCFTESR